MAEQTVRTAVQGDLGARVGRLMARAMGSKSYSRSPDSRNCPGSAIIRVPSRRRPPSETSGDTGYHFLQYAKKHWHVHLTFLTERTESYRILKGILKDGHSAAEIPWMKDDFQRQTPSHHLVRQKDRQLMDLQYAIIFSSVTSNHGLLCHAFSLLSEKVDNHSVLTKMLSLMALQGHLDCPNQCIQKVQGRVNHRELVALITKRIASGVPSWPAVGHIAERVCDCSSAERAKGIHNDIFQVINSGYDASIHKSLRTFALVSRGSFTPQSFKEYCEQKQLTEASLISDRTITGKSILELEVETAKPDSSGHSYKFLLGVLSSVDIEDYAAEIGVDPGELQLLAMKGLRRSLPIGNVGMMRELLLVIQMLNGNADGEDCLMAVQDIMTDAIDYALPSEHIKSLLELCLAQAKTMVNFDQIRRKLFHDAVCKGNWMLAKVLTNLKPRLNMNVTNNSSIQIFQQALECPMCHIDKLPNDGPIEGRVCEPGQRFLFCRNTKSPARVVLQNNLLQAGEKDEYFEILQNVFNDTMNQR